MMDNMDDDDYEEMEPNEQTIRDAVMQSVADGAVSSFLSLERLLAALRPIEMAEETRAGIISSFAVLGRPVPTDAHWHCAYVLEDVIPHGKWCLLTQPDCLLPGYVVIVGNTRHNYARAIQHRCDRVATKLQQAPLN
jgi:hypothetical protein